MKTPHLLIFVLLTALWSCSHDKTFEEIDCSSLHFINNNAKRTITTLPDSAFLLANEALRQALIIDCAAEMAESHETIGIVLSHHGVYQEALNHLLKAEELFQKLGANEKIAENYNQQGLLYYNIRQPDLALSSHRKALALYEKLNDLAGIAYSYGCIGHSYEKKHQYAEALSFQQKALHYYNEEKDHSGMAAILEHIGSIYEDLGNYPVALDYFTRTLRLTEMTGDSITMILSMNNIGDSYRKTGDYKQAIEWTGRAVKIAERLNNKYEMSSAYKDLSKSYALNRDYQNAWQNLETGRNLYEEMFERDASRQLSLFQTLFQIERKNHDIAQLENDGRLNKLIKAALSFSLLMITLLGATVISRQRLKIKNNGEVIEQNKQVYEARNKLLSAEVENTHLHEQTLQQELNSKIKSLTAHTLHIIGKNKVLEDIQNRLSEILKNDPSEQRKQIKVVLKMIAHNFIQDKDWEDFRIVFEQVHQDFFDRLQKHAPDLTASESRLASLIRLNIPSKDIAIVLGISQDSLRISRYRLRKKLQLKAGESLTHFVISL